jgi:high-affinity iron transporter
MLLNAVVLVLREVIEAALLISLFLAFSQVHSQSKKTILLGLIAGAIFAIIYAANIRSISQWFDGAGQEIINAVICLLIYLSLLNFAVTALSNYSKKQTQRLSITMMLAVSLASTQEGTEIILYIHGFSSTAELFRPVLLGALIGAGIGLSAGIFIYYILVNTSRKNGLRIGFTMLLLIAGSMVLQIAQLLAQIDWIPSQYPLWNSSAWISEHSLTGQLLYAVIGYEATPTLTQVISYLICLSLIIAFSYYVHFRQQGRSHV